ncbi:hypothetical protein [Paenibacillus periandrae]|uniref:hypothetical protein n=1 Tax=Paenibacillus periandrae TaxID=1761741 RepID=UPI001F09F215|nr:hypothetical protein [Paenibacillus periandrae]
MVIEQKFALMADTSEEICLSEAWSEFIALCADAPRLYDHDQDLLIFANVEQSETVRLKLETYLQAPLETLPLLLLPSATMMRKEFTDYGFTSHSNRIYSYADNLFLFTIHRQGSDAQPQQALEQMEEHLLASCSVSGQAIYITDNHSDELMLRIARAYQCSIEPFHIT